MFLLPFAIGNCPSLRTTRGALDLIHAEEINFPHGRKAVGYRIHADLSVVNRIPAEGCSRVTGHFDAYKTAVDDYVVLRCGWAVTEDKPDIIVNNPIARVS